MKLISELAELKKGDTVIVKGHDWFEGLGHSKVFGEVFNLENGTTKFTIKCKETDSIESVSLENGKIFLIN